MDWMKKYPSTKLLKPFFRYFGSFLFDLSKILRIRMKLKRNWCVQKPQNISQDVETHLNISFHVIGFLPILMNIKFEVGFGYFHESICLHAFVVSFGRGVKLTVFTNRCYSCISNLGDGWKIIMGTCQALPCSMCLKSSSKDFYRK